MGVIKDIIERRVNKTGVSEPVVLVQGTDRVVIELPGVSDVDSVRRLVGQTGQLDFVPLPDVSPQNPPAAGTELPRETYPPLFSGDQIQSAAIGQDPNGGLAVDFTLKGGSPTPARELFAEYTTNHVGELFAITLDERVISAPVDQLADRRRDRPDHRRRPRRLPGQGGQRARHRPQVRLAAVPDRRRSRASRSRRRSATSS